MKKEKKTVVISDKIEVDEKPIEKVEALKKPEVIGDGKEAEKGIALAANVEVEFRGASGKKENLITSLRRKMKKGWK